MLDFAADVDTDVLADLIEPFFKRDLVSERFSSLEIAKLHFGGAAAKSISLLASAL
jgi:hypothetical protein